ncbi:hypothetical protein BDZ45DRAFT_745744 [Acephala macrosclerotiorum]|nr:hypothetical protein BDZ45DRAFT_745744 [Acephala macrosclerotiorum]
MNRKDIALLLGILMADDCTSRRFIWIIAFGPDCPAVAGQLFKLGGNSASHGNWALQLDSQSTHIATFLSHRSSPACIIALPIMD